MRQYLTDAIGRKQQPNVAFGYADLIADADGFIIGTTIGTKPLHEALFELRQLSPQQRVRKFYQMRFGGNRSLVLFCVQSFQRKEGLADLWFDVEALKGAASAKTWPTADEATVLGNAFADVLETY